jgi:hypothetical protein
MYTSIDYSFDVVDKIDGLDKFSPLQLLADFIFLPDILIINNSD